MVGLMLVWRERSGKGDAPHPLGVRSEKSK